MAEARAWGRPRRQALERWLGAVVQLPYDVEVARKWGRLAARAERRGRPAPVNDTWIAACCLVAGAPLLTLNVRDFADFAAHEGLVLLGS